MLFDALGRVLLVRHSYGSGLWALPGGAIGRGEGSADAARRELLEEVRCGVDDLAYFDTVTRNLHGARNTVAMFTGVASGVPVADGREIVEARFFPLNDLPQPLALSTHAWLAEYSERSR
jgi:ADP-ribose pyrophosphatase YjhB (NUDIX family)